MFTQFEEGDLLSETYYDTEISNEYDDHSTLSPLIGEEEIDVMSSSNESGAGPMSTEMLEDICDSIQSHPSINRI